MVIFNPNIFAPNIFLTGTEITSATETSVVERKKSRGRTRPFLKFDVKKFRKVFIGYESKASMEVRAFKPASVREHWVIKSVHLEDLDTVTLLEDAADLVVSELDTKTLLKQAAELTAEAERLLNNSHDNSD